MTSFSKSRQQKNDEEAHLFPISVPRCINDHEVPWEGNLCSKFLAIAVIHFFRVSNFIITLHQQSLLFPWISFFLLFVIVFVLYLFWFCLFVWLGFLCVFFVLSVCLFVFYLFHFWFGVFWDLCLCLCVCVGVFLSVFILKVEVKIIYFL